jgi:hypothetical protein
MSEKENLAAAVRPQLPDIVDPLNLQALFVDWIVTGGMHENVVNLTLGVIDHALKRSEQDHARVVIAARLRCSRDFALRLHGFLGTLLGVAPPPQHDRNEPPPTPPAVKLN